jgi:hypothetical protein
MLEGWVVCWPKLLMLAGASILGRVAPLDKALATDAGQNLGFARRAELLPSLLAAEP